jgi:AcrR family transcriptional regulator
MGTRYASADGRGAEALEGHRTEPLSGRRAEARRNNRMILEAARRVFTQNPSAPISAVAAEAGVGVSALYRRYESKDDLLRTLCTDGLHRYISITEAALADRSSDPWDVFATYLRDIIDSDVHSLTVRLAGTFAPTTEMHQLAESANALTARVFRRAKRAKAIRADLHLNDLAMLFEQLTAVQLGDGDRTRELRRRYLAIQLDGLRPQATTAHLPGSPPASAELGRRWQPR